MAASADSKAKVIGLWALKILLAVAFIGFGAMKLVGVPMLVQEFETIGLGQWFRLLTGLIEIGAAVLLLVPSTARFGALAMLCVSIGALLTQAAILHGDIIHTIVLIAATGFLAWMTWRPQTSARIAAA